MIPSLVETSCCMSLLIKVLVDSDYLNVCGLLSTGYGDIHAVNLRDSIFVMIYVSLDMVCGVYLIEKDLEEAYAIRLKITSGYTDSAILHHLPTLRLSSLQQRGDDLFLSLKIGENMIVLTCSIASVDKCTEGGRTEWKLFQRH
ncbi:hypothetical protein L6452_11779 [Arctium lappa]|uniref:Uncharacterized protein n=1 Tax=Arctium lappa TaxID=4217 RepID=A0ACB9DPL1_ARCLA|nr:hypothetical protein L6452_11779 [Arctium lappa]